MATKMAQVGIRVTEAMNKAIEKEAGRTGRSKSNWIQHVIQAAIDGGRNENSDVIITR